MCLVLQGTPLLFWYLIMVKQTYILALSLVLTLLAGCVKEPDLSNVVVLATPKSDSTLFSNERLRYQLRLFTINEYVDGLTITSFDLERGKMVCLDTLFESKQKELDYDFIYTAPLLNKDKLEVELTFTVKDNLGNTSKIVRHITVQKRQQMIEEKNGIILYAHNAYLPNALSLSDVSQPFVSQYSTDSLNADIWLDPTDTLATITWRSQTGAKFVRHNDLNYATATTENLQATYLSSKRYDAIQQVKANDIILVGHEEWVDGVFLVNNIITGDGFEGESLQLSFKGVTTHIPH